MPVKVISFHYTLTDPEGVQLDSSEGGEPMSFLEGVGQIIPGLEKVLLTLKKGDKSTIEVAAADAYGEPSAELLITVPREKLPKDDIALGDQFSAGEPGGHPMPFTVVEVRETEVILDGNHPLAGVDLKFDVEVTDIREATEDEISHGHAHGAGGHHH